MRRPPDEGRESPPRPPHSNGFSAHDPSVEAYRDTLHRSSLVHIEDARISGKAAPPSGYETHYQIALTYQGLFGYSAGQRNWLIDANRTLFISPGWEFSEQHPVAGMGHSAVLVNPTRQLLDELCGGHGPKKSSAFMEASRPATMRLRLLTQFILHARVHDDPLFKDEWAVHALREAVQTPARGGVRASKIVERAKELLHARASERLSLQEIAGDVGVTPVYLTQEFARCEGTPLYRYQLNMRLTRSLLALPHCDDITGLALDLGFSSHSHFTFLFRTAFGLTPSEFRSTISSSQLRAREMAKIRSNRHAA